MTTQSAYRRKLTHLTYAHFPIGSKWRRWSDILKEDIDYEVVDHLDNGEIEFLLSFSERDWPATETCTHGPLSSVLPVLQPLPEFSADEIRPKDIWMLKDGVEPYYGHPDSKHVFIHSVTDEDVVFAPEGEGLLRLYGISIPKFLARYTK